MAARIEGRPRSFSDPLPRRKDSAQLKQKVQDAASESLVSASQRRASIKRMKGMKPIQNMFLAGGAAFAYSTLGDGSFSSSFILGVAVFFLICFYLLMKDILKSVLISKYLFSLCCQNKQEVEQEARIFEGGHLGYVLEKSLILQRFCKEHEESTVFPREPLKDLQKVLKSWGYCILFDLMRSRFEMFLTGVPSDVCRAYLKQWGEIEPKDFLTQFVDRLSDKNDPHVLHDAEKSRFLVVMGAIEHVMTYEFGRKTDGFYYFSIYNRGEEAEYEPWFQQIESSLDEDNEKDVTVFTVEGLTKAALQHPDFLQGLIEHRRSSRTIAVYDHCQKYLIDEGKGRLKMPTPADLHRFQEYGTCVYSNTSTPLRTVVTDRILWKRLKLYEIEAHLREVGKEYLRGDEPELFSYVSKQIQKIRRQIDL